MLGRYMHRYLSLSHECVGLNREHFDATETWHVRRSLCSYIKQSDVVINCVGVLKPGIKSIGRANTININSVFPQLVADVCEEIGARMIHISSDCVFSGRKGRYIETDICDATDIYARTKCIEPENSLTLRSSFVGEDLNDDGVGLIKWMQRMENTTINGYTNCLWNGVTCLQFVKTVELILNSDTQYSCTRHVYSSQHVTKHQLCKAINQVYDLNITINKTKATNISGTPVFNKLDRTLFTIHDDTLTCDMSIHEQLIEQKAFNL